jgi:hypothetical protein
MALITPTLDYDAFKDVDLVIEAVFENMDVKKQVFKTLDAVCKPGAILASNTSLPERRPDRRHSRSGPQDVIGLHFFSPANVMRLLEVVRGAKTAPDVLATCMALASKIKKIAGGVGRVRRLHRQPHAGALRRRGRRAAERRRHCRSRWTARCSASAWRWGRSAWATWPAWTSAGPRASARPPRPASR